AGILGVGYRRRVEDPRVHAAHALAAALGRAGIRGRRAVRTGEPPEGLPLLASRDSATVARLLHRVGKWSDNFVAEMLLKVLGAERRRPGSSARGVEVLQGVLEDAGVPAGAATLVNGSGLFEGNRIAARHLVALLRHVYQQPAVRSEYLAHLAVGGSEGTLRRRLRDLPAPRIVRAKTGTLNDVIALSGYVLGPEAGSGYAFSVLVNGARGRQGRARALCDDVARTLATALHDP
ncbi:MAG: D-alanyl-D-alanine carboxypeptidase/D-alanyl-D-alanine-endopeptidase, partial [Myxococcota bacterium]